MSFSSDRASLDFLCERFFAEGCLVTVGFTDGEVIARDCSDAASVFDAASSTGDVVVLSLRRAGALCGLFTVLLQDDPDCLVVDHSATALCEAAFEAWFSAADEDA